MTTLVAGSFTTTGYSSPLVSPRADLTVTGFNVSLWGTFVATVQLQRSFDQGTTWLPLTSSGASIGTYTAPCSERLTETEVGVLYRIACTAHTSGTINFRISQ